MTSPDPEYIKEQRLCKKYLKEVEKGFRDTLLKAEEKYPKLKKIPRFSVKCLLDKILKTL